MISRIPVTHVAGVNKCRCRRGCCVTVRSGPAGPAARRESVADGSGIEWTQATWNPTTGCDRVSPGCDHCYALTLSKRLQAMGVAKYAADGDPRTSGPGFGVAVHPGALQVPYRWRQPRLLFVNSISDQFHARDPVASIE